MSESTPGGTGQTVTLVLLGNLGVWDEYVLLREGDDPFNWTDMVAEYAKVVCVSTDEIPGVLGKHDLEEDDRQHHTDQ